MTGNEFLAALGNRMEDTGHSAFSSATKLEALNIAQNTVTNMLDNHYLRGLQTIKAAQTPVAGVIVISTALTGQLPIKNGIMKLYDTSNDLYYRKINTDSWDDVEEEENNTYFASTAAAPSFYVWGDGIYVLPNTLADSVAIFYYRDPTDLAADPVASLISPTCDELILDFAESQLWRQDNKLNRALKAYDHAINVIQMLNARYQAEKPAGING